MPSKSKQQLKLVYAIRGKYKTKKDTPKNFQWVWEEGWGKLEKDAPEKITTNESIFDNLYQVMLEELDSNKEDSKVILDADGVEIRKNDDIVIKKTGEVYRIQNVYPDSNHVTVYINDIDDIEKGSSFSAKDIVKATDQNKTKYFKPIKVPDQPI